MRGVPPGDFFVELSLSPSNAVGLGDYSLTSLMLSLLFHFQPCSFSPAILAIRQQLCQYYTEHVPDISQHADVVVGSIP